MKTLRITGCSVRGIVGGALTPNTVLDVASAFATYTDGGRIFVGRDTRDSSPMLDSAVKAGLVAAGCEVVDYGICPTPLLQHAVRSGDAAGAISITGGHNGMGWNSVTLIDSSGSWLEAATGEEVLGLFHARAFDLRDWEGQGTIQPAAPFFDGYLDALEQHVNGEAIRGAGYKVVVDPIGGAGTPFIRPFCKRFGLELVPIHDQPSGYLPRDPEPRPRSAQHIASIIGHLKGAVGFVHSSDMARTSLVTETGEPASEEYTFAVVANHVLSRQSGTLVTNSCTSRMVDKIAEKHGVPLVKTAVGQSAIVAAVEDEMALLGGEGSGSVCLPAFSPAFDGFLAMALVLEAMAERGAPLSALLNDLPRYHIQKRKRASGSHAAHHAIDRVRERLRAECDGTLSMMDGLRVDWPDRWVHIRASQTEQLVRIIAEGESREAVESLADRMTRIVESEL